LNREILYLLTMNSERKNNALSCLKLLAAIIFLLSSISLQSQTYSVTSRKAVKNFEKAREYFTLNDDSEAESYLRRALKADEHFIEAWFMLAQIYLDKNDIEKAADYYLQGVNVDPDGYAHGFLKVADLKFSIGDYARSKVHLERWKSYSIRDRNSEALAEKLERNLEFALEAVDNPVDFNPEPLGEAINTELFEYWPALSVDEKTIFFTVLGPPNPNLPAGRLKMQEDFYYATREDERWVNRTYLGPPINTNGNEGAQSITADGKFIYFTACDRSDGFGMCDIYFSMADSEGRWSKPENLGEPVNSWYSDKHPAISADGRALYFTSNRPGGKGDYDLWVSEKRDGSWGKPVNLGDSINTPGTEQSPFIHPDQSSLYFSSNGWPGMGKGDIFLSRQKMDGTWGTPVNLGYPVNTHNEEIGLIVNARGDRAYYSSNRREGTDTDIFTFKIPAGVRPDPVSYITGRVYDSRNMKGIGARFELIEPNTGKLVMEASSEPGEGDYLISLPSGAGYAFNVSHPGYLFYSDYFEIDKRYDRLEPLRKDIPLDPLSKGTSVVLNNIFFDVDSYLLNQRSSAELDKIYEFLEQNRSVKIEIAGHTDNTGTDAYNLELSGKRAGQVVDYLTSRGIRSERLVARGYGSSRPVADNATEEGRAKNRRTELTIISIE
jgi:outer membrane protein OmpA-like peptidoglycan-associated protein/tetratricopeptide (TPR) repeat protein